ncbi:MAG: hypothetical protein RLZ84_380, partial [Actinomycetota bacterium]
MQGSQSKGAQRCINWKVSSEYSLYVMHVVILDGLPQVLFSLFKLLLKTYFALFRCLYSLHLIIIG